MEQHIGCPWSSSPNPNLNKATPPKTIHDLPQDLIQNILSRLPIESQLQTAHVCPLWRTVIHRISTMHHGCLKKYPNQPTSLIFLAGKYHTTTSKCIWYLHDLEAVPDTPLNRKSLPFESLLEQGLSVVGSCNGLVCLSDALDLIEGHPNPILILFNPVNGDWLRLSNPPRIGDNLIFFGFGFNATKEEYKLVRMERRVDNELSVQILTFGGNNTWRTIEATTESDITWDHFFGVHVNGYLHWFVFRWGDFLRSYVVGIKIFNLEDETFGVVHLPDSMKSLNHHDLSLGVLGGCLMLVDHSRSKSQNVWLMKDFVSKTWVLEFIISKPPKHPDYMVEDKPKLRPLTMQKNGNVLIQSEFALFSYDLKTRTHEWVRVPGLPRAFTTTMHVATLVKLKDVISGQACEEHCHREEEKESWDMMNTPEKIEAAGVKKEQGNVLFKAGKYSKASKSYEKAAKLIEYDTDFEEEEKKQGKALKVSCNLNNAACKLKLKDYKQAEKLCTKVVEIESKNVKALYRRAQAYIQLGDLELAEIDIKKALEIDPNNRDVKLEYRVLKEKVKEINKKDAKFYGNMFAKKAGEKTEGMSNDSKA